MMHIGSEASGRHNVNSLVLKIGILCTAIPDISQCAVTPVLGAIQEAMPNVPVLIIQLLTSIANGMLLIFCPIYATLTYYVKRKTLLIFGFALFMISAICPVFMLDIASQLIFRAIAGVAAAIVIPITTDYVVNFFEGNEQKNMLGLASCMSATGAMLFQMFGGVFGNIQWNYCYLSSLLAVPFFIYAIAVLPEPKAAHIITSREEGRALREKRKKERQAALRAMTGNAWVMVIYKVLWEIGVMVLAMTCAIVVVGDGVGNTAQAGYIMTGNAVGWLLVSIFYEKIQKVFKRKLLPIASIMFTVAMFICTQAHTIVGFGIAAAMCGIATGIARPGMFDALSLTVPKKARTYSVSLGTSGQGAGGIIAPFLFAAIHGITNTTQGRMTFAITVGIFIVLTLLLIAYCVRVYDKNGNPKVKFD